MFVLTLTVTIVCSLLNLYNIGQSQFINLCYKVIELLNGFITINKFIEHALCLSFVPLKIMAYSSNLLNRSFLLSIVLFVDKLK